MGGRLSCNSSSCLTEDLLIEILLCLPIKTLLRFKSVCKPWLSLIESSEFIHRHSITLSTDNNNILGTFIFPSINEIRDAPGYQVEVLWNMFSVTSDYQYEVFEELPMQQRNPNKVVGSCNGLICLRDDKVRDVSLWNPAINQFRILPKPITFAEINNGKVIGDFAAFGFDVQTKDYKVVLVTYFVTFVPHKGLPLRFISKYHCPYRVQVYSLRTDSWRPLEDLAMPTYPQVGWNGEYHNGSYYGLGEEWISGSRSYSKRMPSSLKTVWWVLSFDFTKEIFRTMQLPDEITGITDNTVVTSLDEKIAIIDRVRTTYHVWVLNELGGKESWTKLYTIGPYEVLNQIPIGISNNGKLILLTDYSIDGKLQLLNLSTQEFHVVKGLQILQYVPHNHLKAIVYRRSLVPVGETPIAPFLNQEAIGWWEDSLVRQDFLQEDSDSFGFPPGFEPSSSPPPGFESAKLRRKAVRIELYRTISMCN